MDEDFTFKRKHSSRSIGSRIFSRTDSPLRSNLEIGHISTSLRKHNDEEFDGDMADWSMEGTGRRVAYDDFTTIGLSNIIIYFRVVFFSLILIYNRLCNSLFYFYLFFVNRLDS